MDGVGDGQNGFAPLSFLAHETNQAILLKSSKPVADGLWADFEGAGNGLNGPAFVVP